MHLKLAFLLWKCHCCLLCKQSSSKGSFLPGARAAPWSAMSQPGKQAQAMEISIGKQKYQRATKAQSPPSSCGEDGLSTNYWWTTTPVYLWSDQILYLTEAHFVGMGAQGEGNNPVQLLPKPRYHSEAQNSDFLLCCWICPPSCKRDGSTRPWAVSIFTLLKDWGNEIKLSDTLSTCYQAK